MIIKRLFLSFRAPKKQHDDSIMTLAPLLRTFWMEGKKTSHRRKNRFIFYFHIRSRYFCALNGRTHEQQSQQKTTRNFSLSSCPSSIIYLILIHFCFSLRYSDLMENRFSPLSFFCEATGKKVSFCSSSFPLDGFEVKRIENAREREKREMEKKNEKFFSF